MPAPGPPQCGGTGPGSLHPEAIFLSGRVLVVEDTPIKKLVSFEVPAGYPRTRACLTDPSMLSLREQLISMLRREAQL